MADVKDDNELIQACRIPESKEYAYTQIVKKYQEKLYWHIRRMVIEHEDTNDVLQNMFIKVWKSIENFREESSLYTWLYRIATNESLTFIEKQKKRMAISIDDEDRSYLTGKLKADTHFDASKIKNAHNWCRHSVMDAMKEGHPIVVVSNTFTQEWEMEVYYLLAEELGYRVTSMIVENRHEGKNIHGCPDDKIEQMKTRFEISL
jgi:RNA polymerase sigma factor (sigma-70 family)